MGKSDLKSIARQVEADAPQSPVEVRAQPDLPKPIERRTETTTINAVPQTEPVIEQVEEALSEQELSNMDASKPEEALLAMEEQTENMVGNPVVSEKSRLLHVVRKISPG